MDNGNHPNSKSRAKLRILLIGLLTVTGICIGGTVAFLTDVTAPVENAFVPSRVTTQVRETLQGGTKTNVTIQNTGTATAYIRAAVVVTWQDQEGNILGTVPVEGTDYSITWEMDGWERGADGFCYYRSPVSPGNGTRVLFTDCAPMGDRAPEGYSLTVEIIGSGIQSVPAAVVTDNWIGGVSGVSRDGTLVIGGEGQ